LQHFPPALDFGTGLGRTTASSTTEFHPGSPAGKQFFEPSAPFGRNRMNHSAASSLLDYELFIAAQGFANAGAISTNARALTPMVSASPRRRRPVGFGPGGGRAAPAGGDDRRPGRDLDGREG
jgi:hypothetical protein